MKIKITVDSTADLSQELMTKNDITPMPICVIIGGEEKRDGVDITTEQLLDYCDEHKELPKTAAPNAEMYAEFFEENLKGYDALIHFNISSKISSIFNNSVEATKRFDGKVFVVDSKSLSTGTGLLALYASELVQMNKFTAKEIYDKVVARVDSVQASFVVNTLKYLHMGGRCSGVARFSASVLGIKPSIRLQDGAMNVGKKYIGRLESCIKKYVEDTLKDFSNPDKKRVFITHTPTKPEYAEMIRKMLEGKFDEIIETNASSTIASHCGRDTIGILFINDGGVQD